MSVKHSKPNFSQSQAVEILKRLFSLTPSEIRSLPSYDDQNFYVADIEGGEYVLKIMNSKDSKNSTLIELQTYAMSFLHQNGLPTQTTVPTISGQLMSLEEKGMKPGTQFRPEEIFHQHVEREMFEYTVVCFSQSMIIMSYLFLSIYLSILDKCLTLKFTHLSFIKHGICIKKKKIFRGWFFFFLNATCSKS